MAPIEVCILDQPTELERQRIRQSGILEEQPRRQGCRRNARLRMRRHPWRIQK